MNYASANEKLKGRQRCKVARNTYLERRGDSIALKLHATDIATFHTSGAVTLNSGMWKTATTKERLSLLVRINQERGQWYVTVGERVYLFRDGMTIGPRGGVTGAPLKDSGGDKAAQRWRMKVRNFADTWTDRLLSGKMDKPGPGDCWFCAMRTTDGKPFGGNEHLKQHVKEGYFVPSLVNGIAEDLSPLARGTVGYLLKLHQQEPGQWGREIAAEQVRSAMRRYMLKGCGETPSTPR